MPKRELCKFCKIKPRAVNYIKKNKTYYRKYCDCCSRKKSKNPEIFKRLAQKNEKNKQCEVCGFVAKYDEQLLILMIKNESKVICLNCQAALKIGKVPDFKIESKIQPHLSIKADF